MFLMKYLIYLDQSISFNMVFYATFENNGESIYYFKIIEYFYTILKSIIKNKLYTQLSILQETSFLSLVERGSWSVVDKVFTSLFSNLNVLSQNKIFVDTWANNSFFYNKDTFDETCDKYGNFNIKEEYSVQDLLKRLSGDIECKIEEIAAAEETYDTDIPDEFIDPIMIIPIKQPIEIPSVEIIVDKYTIYNHLIFNETNPFTNEALCVNDLEIYNNKVEVKERFENFVNTFNNWKTIHKNTIK